MGTIATLERLFWFDDQSRHRRYPNASKLAEWFSPFCARWIQEQVWHPSQEMVSLDDSGLELRLPVTDFREIRMKILQFGVDVTVVAPEILRAEIADEIRKMSEMYDEFRD